ncbi:unknown (plasmid) [Crocosphaera subtropica ATCC 51142]|uniref:Uncharacterized protein n=1 Tax=Crocosphaera subtropica (strain ATCC 51142 / BH68) TaxID=43989 RepID=B1X385_CROS5|nr:unknown [Crocosphaera subtropica ATCC 51142]
MFIFILNYLYKKKLVVLLLLVTVLKRGASIIDKFVNCRNWSHRIILYFIKSLTY